MARLFTEPSYVRGGLSTGLEIARRRGLASGFAKIRAGDDSGWDEAFKADPETTMGVWNDQQRMKQAQANREFNTTNERKNAEYLMSQGWTPEKAINTAFKVNQNPSQTLSPYEKTLQMQQAKNLAEVQQKANALEAGIPEFKKMADELNEIGKDATYTYTGQGLDWLVRQLGGSTKGARAREKYVQTVNNELLPRLRETFGGQLSDAERESLLATLGNVNLSDKEREQAVKAFLESKQRQLEGYKSQIKNMTGGSNLQDKESVKEEVIDWRDL